MKNNILFSVLMLLFFSPLCIAQPDYSLLTGGIIDKQSDKASEEALPSDFGTGKKSGSLPLYVTLKDGAPTPRKQNAGECVGYAVSNALSIVLARRDSITSQTLKDENVLSALYIYNQIQRYGCKGGARIEDGMKLIKEQGDCKASIFEDSGEKCDKLPHEEAINEAAKNKVKDIISVFPVYEEGEMKVFKTKEQLARGIPIVFGMQLPDVFFLEHDFSRPIDLSGADALLGGHAMCVVGYDDHKEAFEVMNSWGTEWGNGGFFWLKYEDYAKYTKYGYAPIITNDTHVQVKSDKDNDITLTGEFAFRTPGGFDETTETPIFSEKKPSFNNKNYIIKDWKRLKVYQLLGHGMTQYSYTYVFSIDPKNKAELHFPESIKINPESLMGADIVPLSKPIVPDGDATIIIPGEFYALQSIHRGTDNVFVIYSYEEIPDIMERIEKVMVSTVKNINKRLDEGFGDILIPSKDITYTKNKMGFTATSNKGFAVPIVLEVIVN